MKNLLRNILSAAGAFYLINSLATRVVTNYINGVEVSFNSARIRWNIANPLIARIVLSYNIRNDNATNITVQGFAGQLLYGTHTLGQIILGEPFLLEGESVNDLSLDVYIDLLNLPQEVVGIIKGGQYLDGLRVKGNVFTSVARVPVDEVIPIL